MVHRDRQCLLSEACIKGAPVNQSKLFIAINENAAPLYISIIAIIT